MDYAEQSRLAMAERDRLIKEQQGAMIALAPPVGIYAAKQRLLQSIALLYGALDQVEDEHVGIGIKEFQHLGGYHGLVELREKSQTQPGFDGDYGFY